MPKSKLELRRGKTSAYRADRTLESYITKTRDKSAARAFMKSALKRHGSPAAIVTDRLKSYRAGMTDLGNEQKQEIGRHANNRAENSHLPFRRRERTMLRFRRMKTLQKFASVHASVSNHFKLERHLVDRQTFNERRSAALAKWQALACYMPNSKTEFHRGETSAHPADNTSSTKNDRK